MPTLLSMRNSRALPERMLSKFRMIPMLLMMGIIFFLSSKTGDSFDVPSFPGIDKLAHFVIYGSLAATVIFAQGRQKAEQNPIRVMVVTVAVCLLYGISDELHQSMVPGRFPSGLDLVADLFGSIAVCLGWLWLRRAREKKIGKPTQSAD